MSTHVKYCIYCGTNTYCTSPYTLLGLTGCSDWPPIEFCSLDCFKAVQKEMAARLEFITNIANNPNEDMRDEARKVLELD